MHAVVKMPHIEINIKGNISPTWNEAAEQSA